MQVELYDSLISKVSSIVDSNNKPLFKNVYVFNDQYRRMLDSKKTGTYLTPACFIEMNFGKTINVGRGLNGIDITYVFHILDNELNSNTNLNSPNNNSNLPLDQNLNIFNLSRTLYNNILGFTPISTGGPLSYITERQSYTHNNLYEYRLVLTNHVFDTTAYNTGLTAAVGLSFSINFGVTHSVCYPGGIGYWRIVDINNPTLCDFIVS